MIEIWIYHVSFDVLEVVRQVLAHLTNLYFN